MDRVSIIDIDEDSASYRALLAETVTAEGFAVRPAFIGELASTAIAATKPQLNFG